MKKNMILTTLWLVALLLPAVAAPASDTYMLSIPSFNMAVGQTFTVNLSLKNEVEFVSLQADLGLPEGLSLTAIDVLSRTTNEAHDTRMAVQRPDGTTRLLCASSSNTPFQESHGPLLRLTFEATAMLPFGVYEVPMTNIMFADGDGMLYEQDATSFTVNVGTASSLVGDVNRDGMTDVSDVTALVSVILGQASYEVFPKNLCDINCDEKVDVSDVTALVSIILMHQ